MPSALRDLENDTVQVLREVRGRFTNPALLWSMGKDSTTLLWLVRKAFFGDVPFPVIHIDTSYKFRQMYEFRDRWSREWGLDLRVHRNEKALAAGMGPTAATKLACCTALKTNALQEALEAGGHDAVLLGIRGDEHGVRAKERVFSPRDRSFGWDYRNQPAEFWDLRQAAVDEGGHMRVHPMLSWREIDIWEYVRQEGIPVPDLYFANDGNRYRSIGCECCCSPARSDAGTVTDVVIEVRRSREGERAGRAQDKEDAAAMEKLRALGYM
ncbi:sulfate adenylyltransferase subunit 2 [Streptomyces antimycoticus]|uniref:Sulfate adenylyltransferase subunit 2 n=1 Tax=Streptomyces antimycoticus TaxID=68175 RepID=A0A499UH87_9ACTN|nr:sulfate adenylyltransferase subunit CysD [Streptomyces antimycoticus]BBJ39520.1 sulfate adenylyltransferase subunit 2 [Streptomyces antimycoticus]